MGSMQYQKVKSVAKQILPKSPKLSEKVLSTMKTVAEIVGATLGPGGSAVLIERQEYGLPNMITKDGVTVFRNLGFTDPAAHCIMEAARDAAVRTANEAGDGTTTATVLAYAIVKATDEFCKANPHVSPQKVVRRLEEVFREHIQPSLKEWSRPADFSTDDGLGLLRSVAKVSANGDDALADAVMECYSLVGDDGNVTITEISGANGYEVEKIDGFPIAMGYEDSTAKFYQKFLNDPANSRTYMEKPIFVLFHGGITEIQSVVFLMEAIGLAWQKEDHPHNVVLVATTFSDSVLGQLAQNFAEQGTINVFPLLAPRSALLTGQYDFLQDLAAVTGATIFDPMNNPLPSSHDAALQILTDRKLGIAFDPETQRGVTAFECGRFRSTVFGHADDVEIESRVAILQKQSENAGSELEKTLVQERIGKITGGIAKLKVMAESSGASREKRDRAEDAVLAVRGAMKHGVLPGGGWALLELKKVLSKLDEPIVTGVLCKALAAPVEMLLANCGFTAQESERIIRDIGVGLVVDVDGEDVSEDFFVYDALRQQYVPSRSGDAVLDSTPAVLEAVRNSISIAGLLGTLGGSVVFYRDLEMERREASDTQSFLRQAGEVNPADERP